MADDKKVKDRIVQYPNRFKLINVETGEDRGDYDLLEVPGEVTEEGTPVDAKLLNKLFDEAERAELVDMQIVKELHQEVQDRTDDSSRLEGLISDEQERAETAEDGLQANIEAEESTRVSEIERVEGLIAAEETRATRREGELDAKIDAQNVTLTGEIARLDGELDDETSTRQSEITRVEGLVTNEAERATAQEGILDDKIDAETNRAKGVEGNLDTKISAIGAVYRFSESSVSSSFSGTTELYKEDLIGGGTPRVDDSVIFPDNKSLVWYVGRITHVNDVTYTVGDIKYIESCWKPSGTWISGVTANYPEVYNYNGGTYICLGRDIATAPVEGQDWFCVAYPPLVRSVAGKTGDVTLDTNDIDGLAELVNAGVEAEEQRALAAEKELEDKITTEESRATAEEARIAGLVSAEKTRAEEQEGVLDAKIDAETARAEGVEETLETAISTEQTRAESEEKKNAAAITAETSRAQGVEQTLSAAIETEESRATGVENALAGRVGAIEGKIPTAASSTNKLVDRDTMNSTITSSAAFFRGSFETKAALNEWQTENPTTATNNDYCYVQDDETQNHQAWRYIYVKSGDAAGEWRPQFKVNNAPLNADQIKALNSGITEEGVTKITETEQGLASEITRAQTEEQKNATAISNEVTRAKAAEEANASAIESEETRALAAEKKNADAIAAIQTKNTSQDTAIAEAKQAADDAAAAVVAEQKRATAAEEQNATDITALETRMDEVEGKNTEQDRAIETAQATAESKYTKPSTGIPKTDLASAVQESLDKADSALQEHQSLAGYATKKEVEAKYTKPEDGIPETDLSQEVQDKLNSGGEQTYDTIISTQEEFAAWYAELDAGTYEGSSVLILSGTYTRSDGKGLHLPDTLKQLHGLGDVQIEITNFSYNSSTNKGGIWYTNTPDGKEYSIENISVSCNSSFFGYGFHSCTNLTNCNGSGRGIDGYGFHSCTNLTNCNGSCSGSNSYGFHSCTNLTNCNGYGTGRDGHGYGFRECTNLTNCTGSGTGSGGRYSGYGFYMCKICSNCRQDPNKSSTTATWGGTNTNVDPDTCPEWVDTRPFPPTPTSSDNGKLLGVTDTKLAYVDSVRPTYFKLNGTPMTDTGGVGTKYTIAKSNLTPSTPTPVVGDTVVFYTDSYTYIGSVTEVQASEIVAEVKVTMLGAAGGSGGGTQIYDTVIASQDDFDAWCKELDAGTYAGHSVVMLHGTYTRSDGKGLHLPDTLYTVKGIGQVKIEIQNFEYSYSRGGILYTTTPTGKEYSIENISLSCASVDTAICFYNCINLINCTSSPTSSHNFDTYGFSNCTNLINCTGSGKYCFSNCTNLINCTGSGNASGVLYGFHTCTNLTNCTGRSSSSSSSNYYNFYNCTNLTNCASSGGTSSDYYSFYNCNYLTNCTSSDYFSFYNCTYLANCTASGSGVSFYSCINCTNCTGSGGTICFRYGTNLTNCTASGSSYGFESCTNLTNCTGTGEYAFYFCKICSNCRQDPDSPSTTATWGGTNTNISRDTCPEYTG